jgi:hypothetical protein
MKILYISNPNSNLTRVWVNWFSKNGNQVAIIADNPLKIEWPNMTIFDLPGRFNLRFIRFYFWEIWTRQILRNWQPDVFTLIESLLLVGLVHLLIFIPLLLLRGGVIFSLTPRDLA